MSYSFRSDPIEKLRARVGERLSEKRMKHVLAVEDMAFRLGLLFFFKDEEALNLLRTAALLHDVTKELTDEEQLAILEAHSVTPLPEDLASMPTIHSLTAAVIIPEEFPEFADPRLIDAVRYHTTGRAGMSICEKLVYLADMLEDGRSFDGVEKLRLLLEEKGADACLKESLKRSLAFVEERDLPVYPLTKRAYEYLKKQGD